MIEITTIMQLKKVMAQTQGKRLGFVATMGALHHGHESLITAAKKANDCVLVSVFVNPMQFNEPQDYQSYPSTLEKDKTLLKKLEVDYLFLPTVNDLYPSGYDFELHPKQTIATLFEGEARPGHFTGMLTVVMKLLILIRPNYAYFGEKDYQQVLLVEHMVKSFFLPTTIVRSPIIRETSGLPMSSRNTKLSVVEKKKVETVYQLLQKESFDDLFQLIEKIEAFQIVVEYLKRYQDRIFLAITIGKVRLIDNFFKDTGPC